MLSRDLLEKAKRFLPAAAPTFIKNLQVFPNWINGGKQFWYEAQNKDGQCCYLVDIGEGSKTLVDDPRKNVKQSEPVPPSQCFTAMQAWGVQPSTPADRLRSPDGQWDLTVKDFDIYLTHTQTGEVRQVTSDGEKFYDWAGSPDCNLAQITNMRLGTIASPIAIWSEDSTKFLTHKVDQRQVKELHLLQNAPEDGTYRPKLYSLRMPFAGDETVTQTELYVFDIVTQKTIKLDTPPIQSTMIGSSIESGYAWFSKTADRVYFIREERGNKKLELCVADTASGRCKTLITETSLHYVELSYLIFWMNYTCTLDVTNEAVWLSEREGWMNLYLVDTKNGGIKNSIAAGDFNVRSICYLDEKERWVYFLASGKEKNIDPYLRILYRAKLDGSNIERLTPAAADHTISFAPNGESFVANYSTLETIPEAKLFSSNGRELLHLEKADFTALCDLGWKKPETFCLKGADGKTDIYGAIYRPTDFDPNRSYAIVDDIYPGPQLVRTAHSYHVDPQGFCMRLFLNFHNHILTLYIV